MAFTFTPIPDELINEMSSWIQRFPSTDIPVEIENKQYEKAYFRQLKYLAKKYDVSIFRLIDYYKGPVTSK